MPYIAPLKTIDYTVPFSASGSPIEPRTITAKLEMSRTCPPLPFTSANQRRRQSPSSSTYLVLSNADAENEDCCSGSSLDDNEQLCPPSDMDCREEEIDADKRETNRLEIRKKSGELVKSALCFVSTRRQLSSKPATPRLSKAVRFDSHLEHIRLFLQLDAPQAVNTDTLLADHHDMSTVSLPSHRSPTSPYPKWDLQRSNFPQSPLLEPHQYVRLEQIYFSADKSVLTGIAMVVNLAYQKLVTARFSFDNWKTSSEVVADYQANASQNQGGEDLDRFLFNVCLDGHRALENNTLHICIRYRVCGLEFWDNNNTRNYQVNFVRISETESAMSKGYLNKSRSEISPERRASGTLIHSTLSSFNNIPSTTCRRLPCTPIISIKSIVDDDDDDHDDAEDIDEYTERPIPLRRDRPVYSIFGTRYDFETSLRAIAQPKTDHGHAEGAGKAQHGLTKLQPTHCGNYLPSFFASRNPVLESSTYRKALDRSCSYDSAHSRTYLSQPLDVL